MRILLQKTFKNFTLKKFIVVAAILLTSVPFLVTTKVQASTDEDLWTKITDNEFSNNYYSIDKVVEDPTNDVLYMQAYVGDYNIYKYDGSALTLITDTAPLNNFNSAESIVFWNDKLYVSYADGESVPKLASYNGAGWTDESDILSPALSQIYKLFVSNDNLIAWVQSEDTHRAIYRYDGASWILVADVDSFTSAEINFDQSSVIDVASSDGYAYFLIQADNGTFAFYLYDFDSEANPQFDVIESAVEGYYGDIEVFDNKVFVASAYSYETGALQVFSLGPVYYTNDGFGDADTREGRLAIVNGELYLSTTKPFGGYARLYKYNKSEEDFDLLSDYIGVADDPDSINSWVMSIGGYGGQVFLGASLAGEGPYMASGWLYGSHAVVTPSIPSIPVASHQSGTYSSALSVTLTSQGSSAIYYTTDGSQPTQSSTLYTGPITINHTTTLKAIGVNAENTLSDILTVQYTISTTTSVVHQTSTTSDDTSSSSDGEEDSQVEDSSQEDDSIVDENDNSSHPTVTNNTTTKSSDEKSSHTTTYISLLLCVSLLVGGFVAFSIYSRQAE